MCTGHQILPKFFNRSIFTKRLVNKPAEIPFKNPPHVSLSILVNQTQFMYYPATQFTYGIQSSVHLNNWFTSGLKSQITLKFNCSARDTAGIIHTIVIR
jgi:hypothetical protein